MTAIKAKNTKPELIVRSLVHKLGYRFRLHAKDLPGKPDVVFRSRKKVIFVHGCFWHLHPDPNCADSRKPKSNTGYWNAKLERNVARDAAHLDALKALGWRPMVLWECEILRSGIKLQRKIERFLR
jgi:DNA mismatch endonuclease (patch repair protein)